MSTLLHRYALLLFISFLQNRAFSQAPESIAYRAIVYDYKGNLIANEFLYQRLTIHDNNDNIVYREIQIKNTDSFGFLNIIIGEGTIEAGNYNSFNWKLADTFKKMELELESSDSFLLIKLNQLLASPLFNYSIAFNNEAGQSILKTNTLFLGDIYLNPLISLRISDVQSRLISGETPLHIYESGIPMDSLYGKTWSGGNIFYLNSKTGSGMVCAFEIKNFGEWKIGEEPIFDAQLEDGLTNNGFMSSIASNKNLNYFVSDSPFGDRFDDYRNWVLPSKEELNLIYKNLKQPGIGKFGPFYYWSSTESDKEKAWGQLFYDGTQKLMNKKSSLAVRLIKHF